MTKRKMSRRNRRESLLRSLEPSRDGGMTTHAANGMAAPLGGRPTECTITGYCRTSIFKYPGSCLVEDVDDQIVHSHGGLTAAIVSDLPAYFERYPAESLHYSIDVSLGAGVHSTYNKAVEQAKRRTHPDLPLFLVIEECADVPTTTLNSGECFTIDECRDGEAVIEGGREGERTLAAFETCDGSWPDFHADMHAVNVVLVAVKAEQNVTDHIERLYSCSCFVSNTRKAVYPLSPTMRASLQVEPRLESKDVREKADRIRSMLQGMMSDSDPSALELFDSMVVDKTKDDNHLRLWYLRLWQAVEDAKKHLGYPQLRNIDTVIAGKRTPKELYDCRTNIAHWYTGRIDFSELNDLQDTAMELLRRKYQPTQDAGSVGRSE